MRPDRSRSPGAATSGRRPVPLGALTMSPTFRFLLALVLAVPGWFLAPRHACHLYSPILHGLLLLSCFVGIPLAAASVRRPWLVWSLLTGAPIVSFLAMLFYVESLHWSVFPRWLLHDSTPNHQVLRTGGSRCGLAVVETPGRLPPAADLGRWA